MSAPAKRSIWITWKPNKRRFEVGFWWGGHLYRFYGWELHGDYIPFTEDARAMADKFKDHVTALMRATTKNKMTFHPALLRALRSKHTLQGTYSFVSYAEQWIDEQDSRAHAGDVTAGYAQSCRGFYLNYWSPHLAGRDLRAIIASDIRVLYVSLLDRGLSKAYVSAVMSKLKTMLKQAAKDLPGVTCPEFPELPQHREREIKWLNIDEQNHVLEFVDDVHKPIVMFLFYEGVRIGEARALQWDCIDFAKGTIVIKRTMSGTDLKESTKDGKDRVIKPHPDTLDMLRKMPWKRGNVFHNNGRRYSRTMLHKIIRTALDKAGFFDVAPKDASRHSVASQWIQDGAPTRVVQAHLGHSDIRTTERYTHVNPGDRYGR